MDNNRPVFIYGLYTDNDDTIMYVGKTVNLLSTRLSSHIHKSKRYNSSKKQKWINKSLNEGYNILIRLIYTCDELNWQECEKKYISKYSNINDKLKNSTKGGEGCCEFTCKYTYKECSEYAIKNNINTGKQWKEFVSSRGIPYGMPRLPYYYNEFKSWGSFLGTNRVSFIEKSKHYTDFNTAMKWVQKNLNRISFKDWTNLDKDKVLPIYIPHSPQFVYKDKGWINWINFVGSTYCNYNEAKLIVKKLNINNKVAWFSYIKDNEIPDNMPRDPMDFYSKNDRGWINCYDFFSKIDKYSNYLSYDESKSWIKKHMNIGSYTEYIKMSKSNNIPEFIPSRPNRFYSNKDRGWIDWYDFLGTNRPVYEYLSYENAKIWIKDNVTINTKEEWVSAVHKSDIPFFIPNHPREHYSRCNRGWLNWRDFLDTLTYDEKYLDYNNMKICVKENLDIKTLIE